MFPCAKCRGDVELGEAGMKGADGFFWKRLTAGLRRCKAAEAPLTVTHCLVNFC